MGDDGNVTLAGAEIRRGTDVEGTGELEPATGGWIRPDTTSLDPAGRSSGAFSLTFADGTVDGTYDTAGLVAHRWWVLADIGVPDAPAVAAQYGLNLDGDEFGRVDNALGEYLAAIPGYQAGVSQLLNDGVTLNLLGIPENTPLTTTTGVPLASMVVVDGDDPVDSSDNFSGSEVFAQEGSVAYTWGQLVSGMFSSGAGELVIRVGLGGDSTPPTLQLVGARLRANVDSSSMTGIVAGAIPADDIEAVLVPALQQSFAAAVAEDCDAAVCTPGSAGEFILANYDANDDGQVTVEELESDIAFQMAIAPDVDLFDADGRFDPNQDGVPDGLSFGVQFSAVSAELAASP